MDTKQWCCCLTVLAGSALLLGGCGGGGDSPDKPEGCVFDSSKPSEIRASYMLAWKLGMNTSAVGAGLNTSFQGNSSYDMTCETGLCSRSQLPTDDTTELWITTTKALIKAGVNVVLKDGALLNVSSLDSKFISDQVEGIMRCYTGSVVGGCGETITKFNSSPTSWMWTVRVKNNCGTYLFNTTDEVTSKKGESNPPCCLPGRGNPDDPDKCEPDVQGKILNLCPTADLQIV